MSSSFRGVPAGFRRCLAAVLAGFCVLTVTMSAASAQATSKARPSADAPSRPAKAARAAPARKAAKPVAKASTKPRTRASGPTSPRVHTVAMQARPSFGHLAGLQSTPDPLDLHSSVALVVDQDTDEVLFSKNSQAVLPIASITKLMTAIVVVDAGAPLDEVLTVSQADVDTEKGSQSRLHVGSKLTRGQMLHLALMSSENRAAHALGRHHPGGMEAFVESMNRKAQELGMKSTRYVEPTGLSSSNQSSAVDLSILVKAAASYPLIREMSTDEGTSVAVGRRVLEFRNTNVLVRNPSWDIVLQKTGYISEAGRCVVMQTQLAGRKLIMVLLDSAGKYSRFGDAERLRRWMMAQLPTEAEAGRSTGLR